MATKTISHVGYGVNAGRSRMELYDLAYGKCTPTTGNKPIRSPFLLGYKTETGFLMKEEAYAEAMKPIHSYGDQVNKTIPQLFPVLEELPPRKILGHDPWHPYPDEIPPILIGDYYEGHDDCRHGSVRQYNLYYEDADDLNNWENLGIVEWRIRGDKMVYIDNPLYQPAVDRNNLCRADYLAILKKYFVVTGNFQFPGYAIGQWEWFEDGIKIGGMNTNPKIPLDENHWLANRTTGWVFRINILPDGTLQNQQWKSKVENTIQLVHLKFHETKMLKALLGIVELTV